MKTKMINQTTDDRMRILSEGKIASAVLAVVGAGSDGNFDDIDDRPASLDLPPRRKAVPQANYSPTRKTNPSSDDKIATSVLAVLGAEPEDYNDLDDHPGSLDLATTPRRSRSS
jgi:hypothetical protein